MSYSQRSKLSGFTVIELLITVALLGLFAAFAAPSFSSFIARQKVDSGARSMTNLFNFVRSESVRLNVPVNVCPLNVNSSTLETTGCKATTDWTSGILAYSIPTGTDAYASGNAVRRLPVDSKQITVTGNVYTDNARQTDSILPFSPEGTYGNGTSFAKFLLQSANDSSICRVVILESSGRAKMCQNNGKDVSEICNCDLPLKY